MDRNHHNRRHILAQKSSPYLKRRSSSRPPTTFTHSPKAHAPRPNIRRDSGRRHLAHDYNDTLNDETFVNRDSDVGDGDPASDDSAFYWEEEATLLSELMDDGLQETEDDELDKLVESLQVPFTEQGTHIKKQIAQTLVGTHKHVKNLYKLLDDNVDAYYGRGIHLFKMASTGIEATLYAEQADLRETYQATQRTIETLLEELKEEYAFRDKLWVTLKASIDEIVTPILETVKDTPAQVERTIVKLDKQLEKDSKQAPNSTKKILEELLLQAS